MKKSKPILNGLTPTNIAAGVIFIGLVFLAFIIGKISVPIPKPQVFDNKPYLEEIKTLKDSIRLKDITIDSLKKSMVKKIEVKKVKQKQTDEKINIIRTQPIDGTVVFLQSRFN